MKELDKYTTDELTTSLIELHKEMKILQEIQNSFENIASNASKVVEQQTKFTGDLKQISIKYNEFSSAFPEVLLDEIKEAFTNSSGALQVETTQFLEGVTSNVTKINTALQGFDKVDTSIKMIVKSIENFQLENTVTSKLENSLKKLHEELQSSLNSTLKGFESSVNTVVEKWTKVDISLYEIGSALKSQVEKYEQIEASHKVLIDTTQSMHETLKTLNLSAKFQIIQNDIKQFNKSIEVLKLNDKQLSNENQLLKEQLLTVLADNKLFKIGFGILILLGVLQFFVN